MKSWKFIFFVVNSWNLRASWLVKCQNNTPYLKPAEMRSIFSTSWRQREEIVSNTLVFFFDIWKTAYRSDFQVSLVWVGLFSNPGTRLGYIFWDRSNFPYPLFRFKKFQTPYFLARKFHNSKWFRRFSYPLNSPLEILLINYLGQLHTQSLLHFFLKADYLFIVHAVWFLYPWESDHFLILTL